MCTNLVVGIVSYLAVFMQFAINHFVVQWWWCRQNSGSIIGWGWSPATSNAHGQNTVLLGSLRYFYKDVHHHQQVLGLKERTWIPIPWVHCNCNWYPNKKKFRKSYKRRTLKGTSFSSSTTLNSLMSSCHHLTVYSVFIDFVNDCFHLFCPLVLVDHLHH